MKSPFYGARCQEFLAALEQKLGGVEFLRLRSNVLFEGKNLASDVVVRRLVLKELFTLEGLPKDMQSALWHHAVDPILERGQNWYAWWIPTVDEFLELQGYSARPFANVPRYLVLSFWPEVMRIQTSIEGAWL